MFVPRFNILAGFRLRSPDIQRNHLVFSANRPLISKFFFRAKFNGNKKESKLNYISSYLTGLERTMQVIKLMAQEISNVSREMHDNKSLVDARLFS